MGRVIPPIALLVFEVVVHGLAGSGSSESEWLKSLALLAMCTMLLLGLSNWRAEENEVLLLKTAFCAMAYGMAGLGVAQILVANVFGYSWLPVPDWMLLRVVDMEHDAARFGDFTRAIGISYEPSFYGIGMVMLTIWCQVLARLVPESKWSTSSKQKHLVVALFGVAISFSFAAWGLLAVSEMAWFVATRRNAVPAVRRGFRRFGFLVVALLVISAAVFLPVLAERLETAYTSWDYRFIGSIELLISPAGDGEMVGNFIGTGIGLEADSQQLYRIYAQQMYFSYLPVIQTVNGWSYVAVTMGWVGLLLNVWIVLGILGVRGRLGSPIFPFLIFAGAYFFAIGRYLDPDWWVMLALFGGLTRPLSEGFGVTQMHKRMLPRPLGAQG
ncbi:MAG: hypothetical protein ACYC1C_13145 [Chloroflexota bacterium]